MTQQPKPGPRTSREVLIAQVLGEIDDLLLRVERLPTLLFEAEAKLTHSASVLDKANDQYRTTIVTFTTQAREELTQYLQRHAADVAMHTMDEQRRLLQEAARVAVRRAVEQFSAADDQSCQQNGARRRRILTGLMEQGFTALLASLLTAVLVMLVVR